MARLSVKQKLRSLVYVTVSGCAAFAGICIWKGDEKFYKKFVLPIVHLLDAERAHHLAVLCSEWRILPKSSYVDPPSLKITAFGKEFKNPIGIAAGFDKDGRAIVGLQDMGFGFVEVGSVTPLPQPGNERPRVFRLAASRAIINRYGFNSEGHEVVSERLDHLKKQIQIPVGINLGKNKFSSMLDYVKGVEKFANVADYLVINISSPNTPGLRDLQTQDNLKMLLTQVVNVRNNLTEKIHKYTPILVKLAPDLSEKELQEIARIVLSPDTKVDGLIICNTTVDRPNDLIGDSKQEMGGLSGRPLKNRSTQMIRIMHRLTNGQIPIVGVGGVFTGQDAYEKIKAGATLVQLYTSLVYEGPPVVTKIKKELSDLLTKDKLNNIKEAVGKDTKL